MREFYYYVFCLGYDIFHGHFEFDECDLAFEEAIRIVGEFMESEEYKDFKLSSYDALKKFAADEIGFRK